MSAKKRIDTDIAVISYEESDILDFYILEKDPGTRTVSFQLSIREAQELRREINSALIEKTRKKSFYDNNKKILNHK